MMKNVERESFMPVGTEVGERVRGNGDGSWSFGKKQGPMMGQLSIEKSAL